MDVMTKEQRHDCMARIKGKNTKPEMIVRRFLWSHGFRYRINYSRLPGRPDLVLPKYRAVIMVNGCFWHGHDGCVYYRLPKSNVDYWRTKIENNKARDMRDREALAKMGWNVIQIWECQLLPKNRDAYLEGLLSLLDGLFLEAHGVKRYVEPEVEPLPYAADEEETYGK
ncbi:MAG: DNA mismatch endonuclease Vsr [Paludibacteraceae bacterium]|nr:DNA mismatch endonuclease Vsr [Paludibacteraceae bacterium]